MTELFAAPRIYTLTRFASRVAQVFEKNHFTAMRITSHSATMNHQSHISSPWLALVAVGLALATLAPVAVVASRFI